MKFQKSACIEPMYAELPFLDRFQAAKDDGFDFVEFWSWTDKDLGAVRDAAERAGIGIAGFNGDAELSLIDPAQRADYLAFLEQSIAAARQVGARSLTIHSNGLGEGGRVLNAYEDLSDTVKLCAMYGTLQACAALAEKNGILLNLEPLNITTDHPGNFLRTARMAAELTRLIGSPMLKVLYDVYHMQLNEGSLCDNIRAYGSQFGHIHIADAPGRHEPGTGEICYPRPLVSTPLLSVVLPNSVITPGLMPVSLLLNARMVWKNRAHFSAKLVLPIAAFVLLGIIPGTLLLRYGSPAKLKLLLGLVIIGLGIEMLTRKPGAQGKPNAVVRSVVSFLSGITAGLFGIDLLFLAYLERVTQKREEFRSNVCFVFLLECLFRGILYLWNGMFTAESLILCAAALPAAFLGMWFGALLDRKISDQTAHKFIIYVFILGGVSNTIYALLQIF